MEKGGKRKKEKKTSNQDRTSTPERKLRKRKGMHTLVGQLTVREIS